MTINETRRRGTLAATAAALSLGLLAVVGLGGCDLFGGPFEVTLTAEDSNPIEGRYIDITATTTAGDVEYIRYEWFEDGEKTYQTDPVFYLSTYGAAGSTIVVKVVAYDGSRSASAEIHIPVRVDTNKYAPTVELTCDPPAPYEGQLVTFTATASDRDPDTVLTYSWTFNSFEVEDCTGPTFEWTPAWGHDYTRVYVTVSDGEHSASDSVAFTVIHPENHAPVIDLSVDKTELWSDEPVTFSVIASDPDGHSFTLTWELDSELIIPDEDTRDTREINRSVTDAVTMRVTAEDYRGMKAEDSVIILVKASATLRVFNNYDDDLVEVRYRAHGSTTWSDNVLSSSLPPDEDRRLFGLETESGLRYDLYAKTASGMVFDTSTEFGEIGYPMDPGSSAAFAVYADGSWYVF